MKAKKIKITKLSVKIVEMHKLVYIYIYVIYIYNK